MANYILTRLNFVDMYSTAYLYNIVARDLPGGKRILVINMMAQHITFNKAIKTVKIKNFMK